MTFDGKAFGAEIVTAFKAHLSDVVTPLLARIDALEKVQPLTGKDGKDGMDSDPVEVAALVRAELEPIAIREIGVMIEKAMPSLPDIPALVKDAVDSLPKPERGPQGERGEQGLKGEAGEDGRDGLDVKDLFRAEGGRLVAVLSNGTTKDLGKFVGEDGAPGVNGIDGVAGKDGADGVGFDDLDLAETDAGLVLRFTRGEQVKEFPLPIVVDRGVFKEGHIYAKGSAVTWGGSLWIAQEQTGDKPDSGKGWRLAVKKGRDGKDGVVRSVNDKPVVKVG